MKVGVAMDIFSFLRGKPKPGNIAKDRLKLVLIHDRSNCSPHMMEALKTDIIKVISNYMVIDETDMDIQISNGDTDTGEGGAPTLLIDIPIKAVRKAPGRS